MGKFAETLVFDCCVVIDPPGQGSARFPMSDLEGYAKKVTVGDALKVLEVGKCGLVLYEPMLDIHTVSTMTVATVSYAHAADVLTRGWTSVAMSYDDAAELDHNFSDEIVIIGDMRKDPDPRAYLTKNDFNIIFEPGFEDYPDVEITADVPDAIAIACGVDKILDAETRAFFDVLGANERTDIDPGFDILYAMSHRRELLIRPLTSLNSALADEYRPIAMSGIVSHASLERNPEYRKLMLDTMHIKDLSKIWESFQTAAGFGVRLPATTRREDGAPAHFIEQAMAHVAEELGIWHAVAAYYAGVPVADILAESTRS